MKIASLYQRVFEDWELMERRSIRQRMMHAKRILRHLGEMDAQKLSTDMIRQYQLARKQEGLANATINRDMSTLQRAYRLAYQAGVVKRVPFFPKLKEENVRQGTYTRAQMERLCAELPAQVQKDMVLYAYLTGRRRGEIAQLRWEDVDLVQRRITVRQSTTKNSQPDIIPCDGELYVLLERMSRERGGTDGLVFHRNHRPLGDFHRTFTRAARRAGIPGRLFHDFRRTVATDLTNAGVDQITAMRITGHKDARMFARYNITQIAAVQRGMAKMNAHRTRERKV